MQSYKIIMRRANYDKVAVFFFGTIFVNTLGVSHRGGGAIKLKQLKIK